MQFNRHTAATFLHVDGPAAYQHLRKLAEELPLMIERDPQNEGVFRSRARPVAESLTFPEVVAMCLGASLYTLFDGSDFGQRLKGALKKAIQASSRSETFTDVQRKFYFVSRGGDTVISAAESALQDAVDAVLGSKEVLIEYVHGDGKPENLTVQPLSIALHQHQLYLVGRWGKRRIRPFRLARIKNITATGRTFKYPEEAEYKPKALFRDSFGVFLDIDEPVQRIELRLNKSWKPYVMHHCYHESQELQEEDSHVVLKLKVRICPEVKSWVLSFGAGAEVLAPASLREWAAKEHAAAFENNKSNS